MEGDEIKKQISDIMDYVDVILDHKFVQSIIELRTVEDELQKISEEADEKELIVGQKFNERRKPLFDKRNTILQTIPEFWLTAFMSHPTLSSLLTQEDQKIFKFLSSLEVEDYIDPKFGFTIKFVFNPNPYFEDTQLTKTFRNLKETTKVTATPIKWKDGMGISKGITEEKKGKGKEQAHAQQSFFDWFNVPEPEPEGLKNHDWVADIIKNDLWRNPIQYLNDVADEECSVKEDGDGGDDDVNG